MAIWKSDITKWIGLVVVIIGAAVSAVVWASSEHNNNRDMARIEIKESEKDLKETMKNQYVPLHEFTKIEQKLTDQTKQIDKNANKIDKIDQDIGKLDGKLDTLLENITRRHNNRN